MIEFLYNSRGLQKKNCKLQTLFKKKFLEKHKDSRGGKNKDTREAEALTPTVTANIKHSITW